MAGTSLAADVASGVDMVMTLLDDVEKDAPRRSWQTISLMRRELTRMQVKAETRIDRASYEQARLRGKELAAAALMAKPRSEA